MYFMINLFKMVQNWSTPISKRRPSIATNTIDRMCKDFNNYNCFDVVFYFIIIFYRAMLFNYSSHTTGNNSKTILAIKFDWKEIAYSYNILYYLPSLYFCRFLFIFYMYMLKKTKFITYNHIDH